MRKATFTRALACGVSTLALMAVVSASGAMADDWQNGTYVQDGWGANWSNPVPVSAANIPGLANADQDGAWVLLKNSDDSVVSRTATPDAVNPDGTPKTGYHWAQATYEMENVANKYVSAAGDATYTNPNIAGIDSPNKYLIHTATGELVTGDAAAANAACTAAAPCKWVSKTAVDPKSTTALLPSTDYAFNKADGFAIYNPQVAGSGATAVTNATTSLPGGVVYSNTTTATGVVNNYTAIGPEGLAVRDNSGNSASVTSTEVSVSDAAGNSSVIKADSATFTGSTLTVQSGPGAGASRTVIRDGNISFNESLRAAPGATVDMGGNRVQNVGRPVLATDAANKGYVDAGLSKAYEGTAIAIAMAQPIFHGNQNFAMRGGWGGYEGKSAFALTAAGIVSRGAFGPGTTVTLDGGVGFGADDGTVGGRAGVSIGW